MRYEVSPDGEAKIKAVDGYLRQAIRDGRPIEALIATRWLGEIVSDRAKEAARAATESSWSWTDVGRALGVSKQAAHEKLRASVHGKIERKLSKLERVEQAAHGKIARRATHGREKLDQHPQATPKVESARQRLGDWERREHAKLSRDLQKAREHLSRVEQIVEDRLDKRG
jgi:hypothetical protein